MFLFENIKTVTVYVKDKIIMTIIKTLVIIVITITMILSMKMISISIIQF